MSRVRLAGGHRQKVLALTAAATLVLVAVIVAVIAGRSGTGDASRPARAADPAGAASPPAALPVVYSRVAGWHGGQVRPGGGSRSRARDALRVHGSVRLEGCAYG